MSGRGGGVAWGLRGEVRVGLATTMRRGLARGVIAWIERIERIERIGWILGHGAPGVRGVSGSMMRV